MLAVRLRGPMETRILLFFQSMKMDCWPISPPAANIFAALIMPTPKIIEAAPSVYQVVLPWTRAYILTDGADFSFVDTGTCKDRQRLLSACAALQLDPARCHSVLLTHGHCDHAGNAAFFANQYGAKIYAHAAERLFLETPRRYGPQGLRALGPQGLTFLMGECYWPVQRHKVDVLIAEGEVLETPAGKWRVLHTPGHTPGHVSYFREEDGALLSGDALLNILPYLRMEGVALAQPLFASDMTQAYHSACRIAELAPRLLLPGHGRVLRHHTAERIKRFMRRQASRFS